MQPSASTLGPLKIVVVEDDATVRLFLKDTLEKKLGHQVVGEAAWSSRTTPRYACF